MNKIGLKCDHQIRVKVFYSDQVVGHYSADLFENDLVAVELKTVASLHPDHEAQLLNYLKGTNIEVGMLLNFGSVPDFRRKVFSNVRKGYKHPGK